MDTLYQFDATTTHNPDAAQYTQAYYDAFSEYGLGSQYIPGYGADGVIRTQFDLQGQGLRNGEQPASVYSLFGNEAFLQSFFINYIQNLFCLI